MSLAEFPEARDDYDGRRRWCGICSAVPWEAHQADCPEFAEPVDEPDDPEPECRCDFSFEARTARRDCPMHGIPAQVEALKANFAELRRIEDRLWSLGDTMGETARAIMAAEQADRAAFAERRL